MKKPLKLLVLFLALTSCTTPNKEEVKNTEANESKPLVLHTKETEGKDQQSVPTRPEVIQSTCVSDQDTRIMEVKKTKMGGCELFYTKFGKTQSVATANIGTKYCKEVKERIQVNLEKAGFSCQ